MADSSNEYSEFDALKI